MFSNRVEPVLQQYLEDIFGSADITRTLLYQGTMWTFVILVSPDTYQVHLKFISFAFADVYNKLLGGCLLLKSKRKKKIKSIYNVIKIYKSIKFWIWRISRTRTQGFPGSPINHYSASSAWCLVEYTGDQGLSAPWSLTLLSTTLPQSRRRLVGESIWNQTKIQKCKWRLVLTLLLAPIASHTNVNLIMIHNT